MKRRIFVIVVVIIVSVCSIINFSAIYKDYQREKREQQEKIEALHHMELKKMAYVTGGKVGDDNSMEFDTKQVIMIVALYNEALSRDLVEGEKILGYTEVQEEFNDYMSGRKTWEECSAINALYDFDKAEKCYVENPERGVWYNYSHYITLICVELGTNNEETVSDYMCHTNSEVEDASELAAKKWFDEMEGK